MRSAAVLPLLLLLASTARADVGRLKFGMTTAEVKAARPCKGLVENAAKSQLSCKAVKFAGTAMDLELWMPQTGLARIRYSVRLGPKRPAAESMVDAIFDKLVAQYGPIDMIGGLTNLAGASKLFDNIDASFARFKGKLAGGAMFDAKTPSDDGRKLSGKLTRDRNGYAIEIGFRPDT
jgi:hypothetical protein